MPVADEDGVGQRPRATRALTLGARSGGRSGREDEASGTEAAARTPSRAKGGTGSFRTGSDASCRGPPQSGAVCGELAGGVQNARRGLTETRHSR